MNPENLQQGARVENVSPNVEFAEKFGTQVDYERTVESNITVGSERAAKVSEIDFTSIFPAPSIQVSVTSEPVVSNSNPKDAAHLDIIEKQWVDKAKQIVRDNKDDPYQQGKEVSKLQVDYIEKRYGRELGASN